jgi:DNA modification methylase
MVYAKTAYPFAGTTVTVGVVAKMLGRQCTLIELNPKLTADAQKRIAETPAQTSEDTREGKAEYREGKIAEGASCYVQS